MLRRSIFASVAGLILITTVSAQDQWEILNYDNFGSPISVDYINADTGWIARETGLFRTFDGGEYWELLNEENIFNELEFTSGSIGWSMTGWPEILMRTSDGGLNWDKVLESELGIVHFQAINDTAAIAYVGEIVLKTVNGGSSWSNITPKASGLTYWSSLCFLNMDTGMVVNEEDPLHLFSTFDGGETWEEMDLTEFNEVSLVKYIDRDTILFTGFRAYNGHYLLCKTSDHFKTWSVLIESDQGIDCLYLNEGLMFAIVDSVINRMPGSGTHILKSTDAGLTWKDTEHPVLIDGSHQIYSAGRTLRILINRGFLGTITLVLELESNDKGDHWSQKYIKLPVQDIDFTDQNQGFMIGGSNMLHGEWGALLTTGDGGISWDIITGLKSCPVEIWHTNESRGFMSTMSALGPAAFYTTSDGWDHVEYVLDSFDCCGKSFYFMNDSIGWRICDCGYNDYLLGVTSDVGVTWEPRYVREDYDRYLNSIFFLDKDNGFAVGTDGLLIKFLGEDSLEILPSGTTLPLDQVIFADEDIGIITGGYWSRDEGYHSIMLRTTDGGDHWTEFPDMPFLIHDVCFSDSLSGVAVGEEFEKGRGIILETSDAGESWEVVTDTLPEPMRALDFKDGVTWAIGDNSLILHKGSSIFPRIKDHITSYMLVGDPHHYSPSPDFSQSLLYEFAMEAIEEEVDFIFVPGDLIIRGTDDPGALDSLLQDWRFVLDTLDHHDIRLFACRGNNDIYSGPAWDSLFSGIYQFPLNGPEGEKNLTFALKFENLLFVALDEYADPHKVNQAWLNGIFDNADQEHIFVAGHEPAFQIYKTDCLGVNPGERNLFWESLANAGVKAYFCGHSHFYDHTLIDDGDGDQDNDVHQVIVGTGGGYFHPDAAYDGDNGSWIPQRQYHEEANGYVLVELKGDEALMTWKQRTGPGIFGTGKDSCSFTCQKPVSAEIVLDKILFGTDKQLQNHPNPFSATTIIAYQLFSDCAVELHVYDMFGRRVATLDTGYRHAGIREVSWNTNGMDPGLYICELRTPEGRQVLKMILTK